MQEREDVTCLEPCQDLLPVQQQPGGPLVLVQEETGARHTRGGQEVALLGFGKGAVCGVSESVIG